MEELGLVGFVKSTSYFQGTLYAAFRTNTGVLLGSYNLQENAWKEVFTVQSQPPGHPELILYKNCMFMPVWLDGEAPLDYRYSHFLRTSIFEIREIMKDSSSSKSVVKNPHSEMARIFYGEEDRIGLQYDTACGFPINSHSVLLVSSNSEKLVVYNVMSGCVARLPAHPLSQASSELAKEDSLCVTFSAKLMNLSVRNILASSYRFQPAASGTVVGVHDFFSQCNK